jgi:hypothetical protein
MATFRMGADHFSGSDANDMHGYLHLALNGSPNYLIGKLDVLRVECPWWQRSLPRQRW